LAPSARARWSRTGSIWTPSARPSRPTSAPIPSRSQCPSARGDVRTIVRVLVTGGAGFIGSHVVDRLIAAGHTVSVVGDLSTGLASHVKPRATLHTCDIRTPELPRVVAAVRPQAVVHLAAQAAVPRSVEDPMFDASVNV